MTEIEPPDLKRQSELAKYARYYDKTRERQLARLKSINDVKRQQHWRAELTRKGLSLDTPIPRIIGPLATYSPEQRLQRRRARDRLNHALRGARAVGNQAEIDRLQAERRKMDEVVTAGEIVNNLLEDDMSPEATDDYLMNSQEYLMAKLPEEVALILQASLPEEKAAFFTKQKAVFGFDPEEDIHWPQQCPVEGYTDFWYFSEFRTEDGRLFQDVYMSDWDDDIDAVVVESAEVGTPEWYDLVYDTFACKHYHHDRADYFRFCAKQGADPLHFIDNTPPEGRSFRATALLHAEKEDQLAKEAPSSVLNSPYR